MSGRTCRPLPHCWACHAIGEHCTLTTDRVYVIRMRRVRSQRCCSLHPFSVGSAPRWGDLIADAARRLYLTAWSALLCVICLNSVASAQMTVPDCASDAVCNGIYVRARQQSSQNNLSEALRLYKLAYQVIPDPRLLYSIARLLHREGSITDARWYYQKFIDSEIDDLQQKEKARSYLLQLPEIGQKSTPTVPAASAPIYATPVEERPVERVSTLGGRRFPIAAAVLLTAGGATLISGLICGGLALSLEKAIVSTSAPYDPELYSRGTMLNHAAISLSIIGGVIVSGGLVWTIAWGRNARRRVVLNSNVDQNMR